MVLEQIRDVVQGMATPELQPASNQQVATIPEGQAPQQPVEGSEAQAVEISREDLEGALDALNQAISILNHQLSFSIDESTGRLLTKVVDSTTGEIIRQIPPERVLAFVRRFQEFLGLLVDEKA